MIDRQREKKVSKLKIKKIGRKEKIIKGWEREREGKKKALKWGQSNLVTSVLLTRRQY